jgi:hypothetical protein
MLSLVLDRLVFRGNNLTVKGGPKPGPRQKCGKNRKRKKDPTASPRWSACGRQLAVVAAPPGGALPGPDLLQGDPAMRAACAPGELATCSASLLPRGARRRPQAAPPPGERVASLSGSSPPWWRVVWSAPGAR